MPASAFEVTVDGAPVGVREAALPGPRRAVLLTLSQTLEGGQSLGFESWGGPLGANGEAAALWAADLRLVHVPAEATLAGDLADVFGAGAAD